MESRSIHPRVENGRTVHEKVNTAKPWGGLNKDFAKRRDKLSKRRLIREGIVIVMSRSGKTGNAAGAFKAPGSMNQHKR